MFNFNETINEVIFCGVEDTPHSIAMLKKDYVELKQKYTQAQIEIVELKDKNCCLEDFTKNLLTENIELKRSIGLTNSKTTEVRI